MLLEVKNLKVHFHMRESVIRAVDGVDFEVDNGEVLGIVGESGCGKSVTSLAIMGLISSPAAKIESGDIIFNGRNLVKCSKNELQAIRGNGISMIFQEPMTALNPVLRIGEQIEEPLVIHNKGSKGDLKERCMELLNMVKIPDANRIYYKYPHELSGGMRQRVMIAMALACSPQLLIADEPTTALDVTIQAQVLDLMKGLIEQINAGVILITHDLGVVAEMAQKVMVMYSGKVVENADVLSLFKNPLHPYTKGLLKSKPNVMDDSSKLYTIKGSLPNPRSMPSGCIFHPRCPECMPVCKEKEPVLREYEDRHKARCWLYDK